MTLREIGRFYKDVTVAQEGGRFVVLLDGRPVKTPQRNALCLPTRTLAEAVAEEWAAQEKKIDLDRMPLTRLANTANELTDAHRKAAIDKIIAYGNADLLSYRAEAPDELVHREATLWDPLLDWAAGKYGHRLSSGRGIAFVEQKAEALSALERAVSAHDGFGLTGLHSAAAITGSLILALALAEGRLEAEEVFEISRLDEAFQAEKWGQDAAAEARTARLKAELEAAARFLKLGAA